MSDQWQARLRALYLIAVSIGVFFTREPWILASALAVQWLGAVAAGVTVGELARRLKKLFVFFALIEICYSLISIDKSHDLWETVSLGLFDLPINTYGATTGLVMILRIATVVFASHLIRQGDPRQLVRGLTGLGMPKTAALSLDATLALLGDTGRKKGGGGGGGGGRGRGRKRRGKSQDANNPEADDGFMKSVRRLARGDMSFIVSRLHNHIDRVEEYLADKSDDDKATSRDIAVISGVALTMLGIKALKVLPGLPFAPGHKGVLLIPLYITAGAMTRSRFGATWTGLTMGICSFLMGDGRWGVFEIAKHVAPGLLVDLFYPFVRARRGYRGVVAWSIFGAVIALGRYTTVTAIALLMEAPALVYAVLLPGLAIHGSFGIISGIVTAPLVRALDNRKADGGPSAQSK